MSTSSPPHPQNEFECPFADSYCSTVKAYAPPKYSGWSRLQSNRSIQKRILLNEHRDEHLLVTKFINPNGHVSWVCPRTVIQVSIIQRKNINIMENDAVPFSHLHGLNKADVEQCTFIEPKLWRLLYNENLIFHLLSHH